MIFSNLFHRKKNKESETGSFSQYDQSEYAKLETKNIVKVGNKAAVQKEDGQEPIDE